MKVKLRFQDVEEKGVIAPLEVWMNANSTPKGKMISLFFIQLRK